MAQPGRMVEHFGWATSSRSSDEGTQVVGFVMKLPMASTFHGKTEFWERISAFEVPMLPTFAAPSVPKHCPSPAVALPARHQGRPAVTNWLSNGPPMASTYSQ